MNWDAIGFDWNQVRAFFAAAEEGSFSRAAKVLKTTQPTISRQISALEEALSLTLIERSTRGLTITKAGQDLLDHVRAMGDAATLISMAADGKSQAVSGEVTISATDLVSSAFLPRFLKPLQAEAPGVRIRIHSSNENANLQHRDADIAIRHVRPEQGDLIAKHLGDFRASLYAHKTYLAETGKPTSPADIAKMRFIGNADPDRLLAPLHHMGIFVPAENFVMASDNGIVAWEMLRAGFGISMQPDILAEPEPDIVKVMPSLPSLQFPIWLVTHRELKTNRLIRTVFDLLAREISGLAKEFARH